MLDMLCDEAERLKVQLGSKLERDRNNNQPSEESFRPLSLNRRRENRSIN